MVPRGGEIGLAVMPSGEEPMRSRIMGVAIAVDVGKTVYIPVVADSVEPVANALRDMFAKAGCVNAAPTVEIQPIQRHKIRCCIIALERCLSLHYPAHKNAVYPRIL